MPKALRQRPVGVNPPQPSSNTRVLRSHTAAAAQASAVTKRNLRPRRKRADPWTPKRKPANPNPRPRAPPPTHFTCRICIEEQTTDQFPKWISPKSRRWRAAPDIPYLCIDHLARNPSRKKIDPVCKTCIGNTMSARLDQLGARRVGHGCLEPGCTVWWRWELILQYMPAGAPLEKYNIEMLEVWKQDATPKPFTCLKPGCGAIGLPDTMAPGYPQVSCNSCAFRSCAQCLIPWHKGLSCAEHASKHIDDQMTDPEKETLNLMQGKDGKRCPNCYLVIEKDGGCDSMYCGGCQKYFNWASAGQLYMFLKDFAVLIAGQHLRCPAPRSLIPSAITSGITRAR